MTGPRLLAGVRGEVMGKAQHNWRFIADRSAVTALEYGIIAAFFVVLLVAIFSNFGNTLVAMYGRVTSGI